jgi:hypothetical protein
MHVLIHKRSAVSGIALLQAMNQGQKSCDVIYEGPSPPPTYDTHMALKYVSKPLLEN